MRLKNILKIFSCVVMTPGLIFCNTLFSEEINTSSENKESALINTSGAEKTTVDLSFLGGEFSSSDKKINETKASSSTTPAEKSFVSPALSSILVEKPISKQGNEKLRLNSFYQSTISIFSKEAYEAVVENLILAYEKETGRKLVPGEKKKVGLKILTRGGKAFSTPKNLTLAVRDILVSRGFKKENILIVDFEERNLRQSGYLPPFKKPNDFFFEGSPVLAMSTGKYYAEKWFYSSNLLPTLSYYLDRGNKWMTPENATKSFLPTPLLFDVDFWINLPVVSDDNTIGVSGALANASIWNISNSERFLENPFNARKTMAEILMQTELRKKNEFTILSLEKYQYVGDKVFNENYSVSENTVWLSSNAVLLDFLMWQKINSIRKKIGIEEIQPEPEIFVDLIQYANVLGDCKLEKIKLIKVD